MSHKFFMNFVENLRLLLIFEVFDMENSYQLQNILKNFEFFFVFINHNEQHNGG
jgi:hypothetical protein